MGTIRGGIAVAHDLGVAGFGRKRGMISAINGFALAPAPYAAGLLWTGGGYAPVLAGLSGPARVGALASWSLPAAGRTRADATQPRATRPSNRTSIKPTTLYTASRRFVHASKS